VPALQMLWESATKILSGDDSSSRDEYIQSMEKLAEISGAGKLTSP